MTDYDKIVTEKINAQWNKGINPAIYNGHEYFKPNPDKRIKEIDNQIIKLQSERKGLVDQWINFSKTFEEKFEYWFLHSENKEHFRDIPDRNKYPLLRAWIDDCDFQRHRTIDLEDWMYDDFGLIFDKKYKEDMLSQDGWVTEKQIEKIYALGKEVMDNNIGSFTIDW